MIVNGYSTAQDEILDIVERMKADYPGLEIEVDNRCAVDQRTVSQYLQVQIVDLSGEQLELGEDPVTKQWSQIQLCAVIKAGDGTAEANKLLDFAVRYFHLHKGCVIDCHAASKRKGSEVNGWWYQPAIINFWYYWK